MNNLNTVAPQAKKPIESLKGLNTTENLMADLEKLQDVAKQISAKGCELINFLPTDHEPTLWVLPSPSFKGLIVGLNIEEIQRVSFSVGTQVIRRVIINGVSVQWLQMESSVKSINVSSRRDKPEENHSENNAIKKDPVITSHLINTLWPVPNKARIGSSL